MNVEWAVAAAAIAAAACAVVLAATWRRPAWRAPAMSATAVVAVLALVPRIDAAPPGRLVVGAIGAGVVAAIATELTGRLYDDGLVAGAMVTLTAVGVYLAVPDTELPAAGWGAIAVAALFRSVRVFGSLGHANPHRTGSAGASAGVGVGVLAIAVTLGVMHGAAGRPASAIGAFAGFGLLLVLPAARTRRRIPWPLALAGQGAFAVATARLAGVERDWPTASARSAALLALALAVVLLYDALGTRRSVRTEPSPTRSPSRTA